MAQVVQPHAAQSAALPVRQVRVVLEPHLVHQRDEQLRHVVGPQRGAVLAGEHEAVVAVRLLPLAALLVLPQLVRQQRPDRGLVEVDHAILAALRLGLGEGDAEVALITVWAGRGRQIALLTAALLHDLLPYDDDPLREVDVVPAKAARLAAAHPSAGDDLVHGAKAVRADVVKEDTEFGRLPWGDLGAGRYGQLDALGRVGADEVLFLGGRERTAQRRVYAAHGRRFALPVGYLGEQFVDMRRTQVA
nr:hypothetical protein [Streptomyces sp. NRRL B-1677]